MLQISFVRNTTSNKIAFLFAQLFDVRRLISYFSLKKMYSQKQSGARIGVFSLQSMDPIFPFYWNFYFIFARQEERQIPLLVTPHGPAPSQVKAKSP